jgi:hypothetical protein
LAELKPAGRSGNCRPFSDGESAPKESVGTAEADIRSVLRKSTLDTPFVLSIGNGRSKIEARRIYNDNRPHRALGKHALALTFGRNDDGNTLDDRHSGLRSRDRLWRWRIFVQPEFDPDHRCNLSDYD